MAVKCHTDKGKTPAGRPAGVFSGESEIRTRDTLLGYTRFPGVPLQPLEHLSIKDCKDRNYFGIPNRIGVFFSDYPQNIPGPAHPVPPARRP